MKYWLMVVLIIILAAKDSSFAGTKLDFKTIDMLTYQCFIDQKWDSVIVVGKQALHEDIDYYYLRVRLGIAYFNKRAYIPATIHLKKARQFNSGDPIVCDYLYRAYIYSNQNEEAGLLRSAFTKEDQMLEDSKSGFLQLVHFEGGYTLSSDNAPKNINALMGKDSIYGQRDLYGNSSYGNLGLMFRISNRINIGVAYNYLDFTKTNYIQYGRLEAHMKSITDTSWGENYNYSFPWVAHDTSFKYHVSQQEFYINPSIALPWGIKIIPAFHWIHVAYSMVTPKYNLDTIRDTAYYTNFDQTYHTFPFSLSRYSFSRKDTAYNNYLVSLRITKDVGRFTLGLTGSWSDLNNKTQFQTALLLTYFPFGNLNYYETTTLTGFYQGSGKRILFSQILGARITPWLWLEGNFYYGDYTNANIFNGSVVYNNSGLIDFRAGANLTFVLSHHFYITLIYQYFRKESQQFYYTKTTDPDTHLPVASLTTQNNPYNTNTLIGGITWKLY